MQKTQQETKDSQAGDQCQHEIYLIRPCTKAETQFCFHYLFSIVK